MTTRFRIDRISLLNMKWVRMRFEDLSKFNKLLVFTKDAMRQIEPKENVLNFNISYWLKTGRIIALKKGVYILADRYEKENDKSGFLEYLANLIYQPSYLSAEYVMAKYGLLTESVFGISSVSKKTSRMFKNKLGVFTYYSILPELFTGFETKLVGGISIFIAKKEKAVFDFLYFRLLKSAVINSKVIEELRINWENMTKSEFKKMFEYTKKIKNAKILKALKLIRKEYYA